MVCGGYVYVACSYTWCGDGSCKTKGSSYQCDCNAGSYNLRNTITLPCFNPCKFFKIGIRISLQFDLLTATVLCIGSGSLGADCQDHGAGTPSSSPPGNFTYRFAYNIWYLIYAYNHIFCAFYCRIERDKKGLDTVNFRCCISSIDIRKIQMEVMYVTHFCQLWCKKIIIVLV